MAAGKTGPKGAFLGEGLPLWQGGIQSASPFFTQGFLFL
jgi:hypothetical protein